MTSSNAIDPASDLRLRVILCADDYALSPAVSRGIRELLAIGRLSATGAMTNRPHWPEAARDLKAFSGKADLGVHLNLTCGEPLRPMPRLAPGGRLPALGVIQKAAALSPAARSEIAGEIARQLDAFEREMGRAPDFVDGHQHVHALPGVRGAVIAEIVRRYPSGSVWLRDPSDSIAAILTRGVAIKKALTVKLLALGLARRARRAGIPTNEGFSGFSPFDPARDFARDLHHYLTAPGRRHLIMCHPGHVDAELVAADPVVAARPLELAALRESAVLEKVGVCRFLGRNPEPGRPDIMEN